MGTVIIVIIAFIAGWAGHVLFGYCMRKKETETMKLIIAVCLANGFAWAWFSYYLAATEHTQIAESISQSAVTEIVGVVLAYAIKSAVENLSKHNDWPDKPSDTGLDSGSNTDEPVG